MIVETVAPQGADVMARFRSRLKQLMWERSVKEGRMLTQKEVETETEVPYHTIQRWYDDEKEFDRIDAKILYPLLDYFGCKFEDLIERVDE